MDKNKILMIWGIGAVGSTILHYLKDNIDVTYSNIFMVDILDKSNIDIVKDYVSKGSKFFEVDLNIKYKDIIAELPKQSIIIDVTNRTNSIEFIRSCKEHNIHYINTSIEDIN